MATPLDLTPGTWTIDQAHSALGFSVKHLMISKVRGSFAAFAGSVTVPEDRYASSVEVTIDPASVSTGDANRDRHLRTGDFFDVENHPQWTFRSTAVKPDGADEFLLVGDLTIRGVTRQVALEAEFEGVTRDAWGNTKAGFSAEAEISRKDWGLEYNAALEAGGVVIGDKVKLSLDIQLAKAD
jgi:polyisoprenoid-binding protein YceI